MGGLYDLLETYRIQNDPRFAYEGLYQDPMKPKNNIRDYFTYNPDASPYGLTDAEDFQPFQSSSFPQEFGVGSLFDPRVGQTDYPITRTIQEDEDEDEDEDQMIQEITTPYTGVTGMGYQTPRTIADQNRVLGQTFTEQKPSGIARLFEVLGNIPTPFNLARRGLESLSGFNQRLRNTDFGQSRTLQEYFERKRQRDQAKRAQEAMPGVYESAREQGFTNDRGGFSTTSADKAGTSVGSGQFSPSTSRGRSGY